MNKTLRRLLTGILLSAFALTISGCSLSSNQNNAMLNYDYSKMDLIQLDEPYDGQPMCIIDTTLGTIKAVLYPELAPNAVNNFTERINDGFYDNKLIYNIGTDGAYFMTGAYDDTFSTGVTPDGEPIPNEYSVDLWPFKGALTALYNKAGYFDSRFLITNKYELTEEDTKQLRAYTNADGEQLFPEKLIKTMEENDGYWQISGCFTIFGQTIEGFDVIDKITSVVADESTFRPIEDIYINSITLTEYSAGNAEELF